MMQLVSVAMAVAAAAASHPPSRGATAWSLPAMDVLPSAQLQAPDCAVVDVRRAGYGAALARVLEYAEGPPAVTACAAPPAGPPPAARRGTSWRDAP